MLNVAAALVTLTALFSFINYRFIKLPTPIGVMSVALLLSLGLIGLGAYFPAYADPAKALIQSIDFDQVLLNGMLSFLLFAGAMHVDVGDLRQRGWTIGVLATVGVLASTLIIGGMAWAVFGGLLGFDMPLIYWLLLGAILAPTDPIAVLGIMKAANAPKSLEIKIVGESLFNDGVAVVVFSILLGMAVGGGDITAAGAAWLFVEETLGGALFGLITGYLTYAMLKQVDNYSVEVLLTVALVFGGFALAQYLHLSGPIAMVVAGLMIGNRGRQHAMSDLTRDRLDAFWEIVDEILNAVLFVLIGLEVLVLTVRGDYLTLAVAMIPLALLVRFACVGVPISILRRFGVEYSPHAVKLLTWGGIRGGISVALALALPRSPERDLILTVTYVLVLFSILVQGLSIGGVVRAALSKSESS